MAGGAVTVIDYFSHYLLAIHLTASYAAVEINKAIDQARARAEATHKLRYRMRFSRSLLGRRALELNVGFSPFSSAMPPGAGGQGGHPVRPDLTHCGS